MVGGDGEKRMDSLGTGLAGGLTETGRRRSGEITGLVLFTQVRIFEWGRGHTGVKIRGSI